MSPSRATSPRARLATKGWFIANSACCDTVVSLRCGACRSGFAKSNVRIAVVRNWRSTNPYSVRRRLSLPAANSSAARPPIVRVQLAGDRQQRVAPLLERQPPDVHPPEQTILGINRQRLLACDLVARSLRLLLISGRQHNQPMERLGAPAVGHERRCQPIEQLWMCRRLRTHSEIAWRAYEPSAEVMHPDAIHPHAGRQRIVGRRDGAGHLQASAAVHERLPIVAREHLEKAARNFVPFCGRIAAAKYPRLLHHLAIDKCHRVRRRLRRLNQPAVNFALQLPQLLVLVMSKYHSLPTIASSGTAQGDCGP